MAAPARRLPRRVDDRDPARAPVGQPARARGSTASAASRSTYAASRSPTTATACRSTATSARHRSRSQRLEPGTAARAFRLRRTTRTKLAAFPFPHTVEVDARLDAARSAPHDRSSSRPAASRYRSRSAGTRTSQLPSGRRADWIAALARVRARRGRRAHHPDGRPHPAARRSRADRAPHVRRPLRARPRPALLRRVRRTRTAPALRRQLSVRPAVRPAPPASSSRSNP